MRPPRCGLLRTKKLGVGPSCLGPSRILLPRAFRLKPPGRGRTPSEKVPDLSRASVSNTQRGDGIHTLNLRRYHLYRGRFFAICARHTGQP